MRASVNPACSIFLIAVLVLAAAGCCSPCETNDENKKVVEQSAAALNAYDYDALDAVMAADYKRHCQATPDATVESLEDFKNLVRTWESSFPDAKMTIHYMVAEGDLVSVWGTWTATHTGPMGDIPATGKEVSLDFGGMHRLLDGKIVETWVTWDNNTMMKQLGMSPGQEEKAEEVPPDTI